MLEHKTKVDHVYLSYRDSFPLYPLDLELFT